MNADGQNTASFSSNLMSRRSCKLSTKRLIKMTKSSFLSILSQPAPATWIRFFVMHQLTRKPHTCWFQNETISPFVTLLTLNELEFWVKLNIKTYEKPHNYHFNQIDQIVGSSPPITQTPSRFRGITALRYIFTLGIKIHEILIAPSESKTWKS